MSDREISEWILDNRRIFQSVFNDLNMRHEIVTLTDGTQRYAYVYDGTDPYELEDSAFPTTVALITKAVKEGKIEELKSLISHPHRGGLNNTEVRATQRIAALEEEHGQLFPSN